ncbi:MAG: transcription termination factor Rho [bacterium]|nr:transcription termination factor Rho [bacterium]
MREKLQTLSLLQLRDLAKSQGIKGVTTLRKSELIDKLCEIDAETSKTAPESPKPFMGTAEASSSYGSRVQRENQNRYYQTANTNENGNLSGNGTGNSYGNSNNNGTGNSYGNSYRFQRNGSYYPRSPYKEFSSQELSELDSGIEACGILEVMPDGFGFIRCENFLPGDDDVYVAPSQIRRFNMKTGDVLKGNRRIKTAAEKFAALLYVTTINGYPASVAEKRPNFEDLTPIFPNSKLHLETNGRTSMSMRIVDLLSPIGKGQRGMIVSPPKAGKTTLLKQIAKAITINHPKMHVIILLIDERPEEVTDIKEAIQGPNVEVIYSTFDELPDHHKRVSEMVIERAKRLVEHGQDVTILLDSITRLARAYNLTVAPSGRTLSGGLDPAALHMPKRFFGAARNMREGGSLTILATALVETGSRMDDVIFEEFKGTGNMELVLDRKLSEKRLFPAIDILKSGTRRDDLLLTRDEASALEVIRRSINTMKAEESVERILSLFSETENNQELVDRVKRRQTL